MTTFNRKLFKVSLLRELRAAWRKLQLDHRSERFYSFGIFTDSLASSIAVTASTEEGLLRVTADYVARFKKPHDLEWQSLRWSVADSPLFEEGQFFLPSSQQLIESDHDPFEDSIESDAIIDFIFGSSIEALSILNRENVFGVGLERENIVLSIWMGDQSHEDCLSYAKLLNPPSVLERFHAELKNGLDAFHKLSELNAK